MYRVEVDWAPAYELVTSMWTYLAREDHKTLELGAEWLRRVRQSLDPEQRAILNPSGKRRDLPLISLVRQCPGDRSAGCFISWLGALSAGKLYELLVHELVPSEHDVLADLASLRETAVRQLTVWDGVYFRHIDPAILEGLRRDAECRREQIAALPPQVLMEQATNGLQLPDENEPEIVALAPQYHFRPWNLYYVQRTIWFIGYPCDALPAVPGEPPAGLLRLARALSDENRLRILHFLAEQPRTFTEIQRFTGLSKSTVHHHMVTLRAASLIRVRAPLAKGTKSDKYFLRPEAIDILADTAREYLATEP